MKQKVIQYFLLVGILLIPIFFIFRENTNLSVRYVAIIFSVFSILLSVFISSVLLKFIYKIFINISKEMLDEIQSLFLGYIFLNSLISLALKDTSFFSVYNVVNPTLLIFLCLITIIYNGIYEKNKLLCAATVFFIMNAIFSLIGVMMNNG
jgi:hypothetical protein